MQLSLTKCIDSYQRYIRTFNMSSVVALISIFLCFLTFLLFRKWTSGGGKLPQGPPSLPFVGNVHQLVGVPVHVKLSQWAQKLGDIYTVKMTSAVNAVVINEPKAIREVFSIFPSSTGKLNTTPFIELFQGEYGILTIGGSDWSEQRQFYLKNIRDLGYGTTTTMESIMESEIKQTVDWITKNSKDKPVFPLYELQKSTLNNIWSLVTGERLASGDCELSELVNNYVKPVQTAMKSGLVFLSWLKYIAPEKSGFNDLKKAGKKVNDYVRRCFERHEANFTENKVNDLIDAYLHRLKTETNRSSTFYGEKGYSQCIATVVALLFGGAEATSSSLTWVLFYLAVHPDKQRKLQEEIDTVLGESGNPRFSDKQRMSYTEAVIMEVLRISSVFPLGLVHKCLENTFYRDYIFPKGTLLIANLYHVHNNQKVWGDPENFRPERFLTKDSKINVRDYVIPWLSGKRACVGEGLARDMLFMYTVKLLQTFDVSPDPKVTDEKMYLKPMDGFLLLPPQIPIQFKLREHR